MSKLYIKMYDPFVITGQDFAQQTSQNMRRTLFSPDSTHCVSIVRLRQDGTVLLTNEGKVSFNLTISRTRRVLAVLKYQPEFSLVSVNNNWRISKEGVTNRAIDKNPDLFMSQHINIDLYGPHIARVDVKVDDSSFACLVFTDKDLLFVRMNGNHAVPRLIDFMESEAERSMTVEKVIGIIEGNAAVKKTVWRRLFQKWFFDGFFGRNN